MDPLLVQQQSETKKPRLQTFHLNTSQLALVLEPTVYEA